MRLGLIGRADNRGIGIQTWEFWANMGQPRTLCVLMNEPGWPEDTGRFGTDVTFVDSNLSPRLHERGLNERRCRQWLQGLDVVFAVETVYDWNLIDWAHQAGAKVVVQLNPEFTCHHHNPDWQQPDLWVNPTTWMRDELMSLGPYGDTILPVPCSTPKPVAADPYDGPLRVLHVVGKAAAHDRAGTSDVVEAIAALREEVHVTIVTQEQEIPFRIRHAHNVTVDVKLNGVADRWDMYENQHLLVSPRRYGGLHLPGLEAMSRGLAVMMPNCSPNDMWPGPRIPARKGTTFRCPFGRIPTFSVHPIDLARAIDLLAREREMLADEMSCALDWAELNCWDELRDRLYEPLLGAL